MNREEAIKILRSKIRTDSFDESFEEIAMDCALTMAVADMEKQIECDIDCKSCWKTKLVNQPKVGEWIPCSERLPSDTAIHEVTAQFSNGTIYTEFAYYDESREEWWKFDDDGLVNVIAWKEHSEPYKGE